MLKQRFKLSIGSYAALALLALAPAARAQLGGTQIVFDPQMFARQLSQLQQQTAAVTNLAQQLQLMIQNTTGGAAGLWSSNQNLLNNLGGIISEQQGLSYTASNLAQQFQQLYPGYAAANTAGVQSPQASVDTTLNTLNGALQSAQAQAQDFSAEQTALTALEVKNQTAVGNLQAVQTGNEIALAQVQQIQMLRQLVIAMTNSQNAAAASQVNNQSQTEMNALAFFGGPPASGFTGLNQTSTAPPPQ